MSGDSRDVQNDALIVGRQRQRGGFDAGALGQGVGDLLEPVVHAGLLLTGGASTRMGRDKATIVAGGASLAERAAATLRAVARPVLAVGPSAGTGCDIVDDPRRGPLVAFDAGSHALAADGHDGPVFLLACDMPLVTASTLARLASLRRGADAVVPIAGGRLQPLCAVYAPRARIVAAGLVAAGAQSMRDLLSAIRIEIVPASAFDDGEDPFADVDTPEDLARIASVLDAPA